MKALVSPNEVRTYEENGVTLEGCRVAQVEQDANMFPVAEPLFWADCPDNCVADQWFYCNGVVREVPPPPAPPAPEEPANP